MKYDAVIIGAGPNGLAAAITLARKNLKVLLVGDITGGVQDIRQLYTRPAIRISPYSTPAKNIYICSASTPPGGGVHGMCGYHAANAALKKVFGIKERD